MEVMRKVEIGSHLPAPAYNSVGATTATFTSAGAGIETKTTIATTKYAANEMHLDVSH